MKLKCKHVRRVMVLPSGTTVHREDGSKCFTPLVMGDQTVVKQFTLHDAPGLPKGTCVLSTDPHKAV